MRVEVIDTVTVTENRTSILTISHTEGTEEFNLGEVSAGDQFPQARVATPDDIGKVIDEIGTEVGEIERTEPNAMDLAVYEHQLRHINFSFMGLRSLVIGGLIVAGSFWAASHTEVPDNLKETSVAAAVALVSGSLATAEATTRFRVTKARTRREHYDSYKPWLAKRHQIRNNLFALLTEDSE